MAESKRVKAEEADLTKANPELNAEETATSKQVADHQEEEGNDEPLEIFSTADDQAFLNEKGEFNWDAYESLGGYTNDERTKLDSRYEETLSVIREREVVEGKVVAINKREVVVNIGYRRCSSC